MKQSFVRLLLAFAAASLAQAHFVFVVPQPGGANAHIFISETLEPDAAVDGALVSGAKLSLRDSNGREQLLTPVNAGNTYTVPITGSGTRVIHGLADLGIRGEGEKQYLLLYHPKAILGDAFDKIGVVGSAPVQLVPVGKEGSLKLWLLAGGKPVADGEVTVILPDGTQTKMKTNESGLTESLTARGRYGAWARYWETGASGERGGKKYAETHHYATLVFDVPASKASAPPSAPPFAKLRQPVASFGAVTSDGWLYIYGGHTAPTHVYSTEAVSGQFSRLRLTGDPIWEDLPGGPGLQGMNLAAYSGKIYRVGGMMPLNKKAEQSDNHSVSDVARFDPATKKWEALPPLPEPRSSHDVVVIGDQLFVTGGWNMKGRSNGQDWAKTVFVMDLATGNPEWASVPQPFKRRALMAAALDGKLYVIGGINESEVVERTVSIYDPKTKQWSEGPLLPEGPVIGFAPAAGVHQGSLYVSVSDGSLLRLNKAGTAWEKAGSSTPRLAHRLASRGDTILVIGGANNGKNSDLIEAVPIGRETAFATPGIPGSQTGKGLGR